MRFAADPFLSENGEKQTSLDSVHSNPGSQFIMTHHFHAESTSGQGEDAYDLPAGIAFDEKSYLTAYPDVRAAVDAGIFTSGQEHYERYGRGEGRLRAGNQPELDSGVGRDGLPIPPSELIFLVTNGRDPEIFQDTGAADLRLVRQAVERAGLQLPERGLRVLDWGCGCGRLARHWAGEADVELHGCDINPDLATWCSENLSFGNFVTSPFNPPLAYADGYFDLIYGISVFTHLTFEQHYLWMREIHRLLSPSGVAVVTGHGPTMLPSVLIDAKMALENGRVRTQLIGQESFVCLEHADGSNASGNALSKDMFSMIFQPFDVRLHRPRFGLMGIHDTYVVTKKTGFALNYLEDLAEFKLNGQTDHHVIQINLSGETHLSMLVDMSGLYYPAMAQFKMGREGAAFEIAPSIAIELPDRVAWTLIDKAYALVEFESFAPQHGSVKLEINVEGTMALDGAVLRLNRMMAF